MLARALLRAAQTAARRIVSGAPKLMPDPAKSATLTDGAKARSYVGYEPPQITRDFARDYPGAARLDAGGRLSHDIDGRLLAAPLVAGRRAAGGSDVPITGSELGGIVSRLNTTFGTAPAAKVVNAEGKRVAGVFLKR